MSPLYELCVFVQAYVPLWVLRDTHRRCLTVWRSRRIGWVTDRKNRCCVGVKHLTDLHVLALFSSGVLASGVLYTCRDIHAHTHRAAQTASFILSTQKHKNPCTNSQIYFYLSLLSWKTLTPNSSKLIILYIFNLFMGVLWFWDIIQLFFVFILHCFAWFQNNINKAIKKKSSHLQLRFISWHFTADIQPILRPDFYFLNFGRKHKTFWGMNVLVLFLLLATPARSNNLISSVCLDE